MIGPVAFEIDHERSRRKRVQNVRQGRHHADAFAAERIGSAAVGRITIAEIQPAQLRHAAIGGASGSIGSTLKGPVVKDRELAIPRLVDIHFDHVRAEIKGSLHAGKGILEKRMGWLKYALSRACVIGQVFSMIGLMHASVRQDLDVVIRYGR